MLKTSLHVTLFCLIFIYLSSCSNDSKLVGKWEAVLITNAEDTLDFAPYKVQFSFHEDNRYDFLSTINLRESGIYKTSGSILELVSPDGTEDPQLIKISFIDRDSMSLVMNNDGLKRTMNLLKVSK